MIKFFSNIKGVDTFVYMVSFEIYHNAVSPNAETETLQMNELCYTSVDHFHLVYKFIEIKF